MDVLIVVYGFIIPAVIGYSLAGILLPERGGAVMVALRICLSWGLGAGATSLLLFFWLFFFGPSGAYPWIESAIALILFGVYMRRSGGPAEPGHGGFAGDGLMLAVSGAAFVAALAAALHIFYANIAMLPNGRWDAWMMWSLRAKAIYVFGENWRWAFDVKYGWTSAEYPLALPLSIARIWMHFSQDGWPPAPAVIGFIFTFSLAGLVAALLTALRGPVHGFAGGAALLSAEMVSLQGSSLFADVPLAFFMTAAAGLAMMAMEREGDNRRIWILAGLCAGLAGWTKNEGLAFMITVLFFAAVISYFKRGKSVLRARIPFMMAGLIPPAVATAWFKVSLAPRAYMLADISSGGYAQKLTDPERLSMVIFGMGDEILHYGGFSIGGWPISAPALALILLAACGARPGIFRSEGWILLFSAVCSMLAMYAMVYMITPVNLRYQMVTSAARLITQVWPLFVMLILAAVGRPWDNFTKGLEGRHE